MDYEAFLAVLKGLEASTAWSWVISAVRVSLWTLGGLFFARVARRLALRLVDTTATTQRGMLVGRGVYYGVLMIALISVLKELGFDLSVLLGAAGVVSVAVGFASQTSASNFISGLFLIAEQPFKVGDAVQIGGVTGEVLSIDALSIKLRTFDNLFVRVPNENVIKGDVINYSRFPIRRMDIQVGVSYGADLDRVKALLIDLALQEVGCLVEPAPQVIVTAFADSSINLELWVWVERQRFLELKSVLMNRIKEVFDAHGVEIPFPQRTIHAATDGAVPMLVAASTSSTRSIQADSGDSADSRSSSSPSSSKPSASSVRRTSSHASLPYDPGHE